MDSFHVYVLKSLSFGCLYVGSTGNLDKRVVQHNEGFSRFTKGRRPWTLIYKESYNSRAEAMRREKFLKSGQGRELLKKLIYSNVER
ncbi:MAG: GIY-YIG nuclease family protein [Candidatus Margulisbacteria bacterium]|nr:GIY-YIG nuclease family protein [Candidatus Margulisiibacteriota bacterium]